jgi:hypothetical protein
MQTGQVFKIDAQAVKEMASFYKRPESDFAQLEGREFSIAKSKVTSAITDSEVRGTKWDDGKPQRGRPRKFPRTTVARLLGETDDASLQPASSSESDDSADSQSDSVSADASDDSADLDGAAEELIAATAPAESKSDDGGDGDDSW